jgi:CheY-like chemotaxis protein/two-component sensor histidine kinase
MDFNIFRNKLTLTFNNKNLEISYSKSQQDILIKYNKYITTIFFLITLVANILIVCNYQLYIGFNSYIKNLTISSFITLVYLCLLMPILLCRGVFIHYITFYFNFLVIFFMFSFFRFYLEMVQNKEQVIGFILLVLDFIFKLFLLSLGTLNITDTFMLCVINSLIIVGYYLPTVPWADLRTYFIGYSCLLVLFLLITYFLIYQKRSTFYLYTKLKGKFTWCRGVIDNLSSGFIYVKNGKIKYINKMLQGKISKFKTLSNEYNSNTDANEIFNLLFSDLYDENDALTPNADDILNRFKENYLGSLFGDNFTFAGIKKLECASSNVSGGDDPKASQYLNTSCGVDEYYFEIYYRYYLNKDTLEDDFEFIFNDVTRAKLNEKKNAEFKYKTLYLAKVAHEFKNPLICINELSEQLTETIKSGSNFDIDKINHSIKSLSNYLLILIKDLDYFCEKQTNEDKDLNITDVNLNELFDFCSDIGNGLLKKAGKENHINLVVEKNEKLQSSVLSDEIKLKQIIVNLLSNSIKFTTRGKIKLKVDHINDNLRFTLSDTGKGISNTEDLFKPFKRGIGSDNKLGTGLGLSIVYDLCIKLGEGIKYKSTVGEGTIFWFDIPYTPGTNLNTHPERTLSDNFVLYRKQSSGIIRGKKRFIQSSINVNRYKRFISPESSSKCIPSDNFSNDTIELKHINFNTNLIQKYYNVNEYHIHHPGSYVKLEQINASDADDDDENIVSCDSAAKRILIVDDDSILRQSTIRAIKASNENVVLIEAEDGCDAIYQIYKHLKQGINISCIISDESMTYLNGTSLAEVVNKLTLQKNLQKIYFFLLTAYNEIASTNSIDKMYKKPLNIINSKEILNLI